MKLSLKNDQSNNSIRDEVLALFIGKKIIKFFSSPCFACRNHLYESDDDCYSNHSYPICEAAYDFSALEYFTDRKKEFPYCEAPKLCHRKGLFRGTRFGGYKSIDELDGIGYGIWASMDDIDYDAPSISGSVIGFHRRMSEVRV